MKCRGFSAEYFHLEISMRVGRNFRGMFHLEISIPHTDFFVVYFYIETSGDTTRNFGKILLVLKMARGTSEGNP